MSEELKPLMGLDIGDVCKTCNGYGQCNDADLGDIYHNVWECPKCGGIGGFGLAGMIAYYMKRKSLGHIESDAPFIADMALNYAASNTVAARTPSPREQKLVEVLQDIREQAVKGFAGAHGQRHSAIIRRVDKALSAYDAPGSQGGENAAVYHVPLYDAEGKVTFQPVTHYPADEEAPISEEEAIEIGNAALLDYAETHGIGKAESDAVEVIAKAVHRALAKRLGWV